MGKKREETYVDYKLLAQLSNSQVAEKLIDNYNTLENIIMNSHSEELDFIEGINETVITQIGIIKKIVNRILNKEQKAIQKINSPAEVYTYCKDMIFYEQEVLRLIMLNIKGEIIKSMDIVKGSVTNSTISAKEVYCYPLRARASAIVLAHNHPSKNPEPSQLDIDWTREIIAAGNLLNIELIDHIIVAKNGGLSLKEEIDWHE